MELSVAYDDGADAFIAVGDPGQVARYLRCPEARCEAVIADILAHADCVQQQRLSIPASMTVAPSSD